MTEAGLDAEQNEDRQTGRIALTDQELDRLRHLVRRYMDAYRMRMPPSEHGAAPALWAGSPLRDEYNAIQAFVRLIPGVERRYDAHTIEWLVDGALRAVLGKPESLDREVRSLAETLDHNLLTKLYIPIDGVIMDAPRYSIGTLSLVHMDDAAYESLIAVPYAEILRENPLYDDQQREGFGKQHREITQPLKGRVCAEIATDLDIPKTFAFAVSEAVDSLCDFLQFAASISALYDPRRKIAWAADTPEAWRRAYAVSDGPATNSLTHTEATSASFPFLISEQSIKSLDELGLTRIADLVGEGARSEYDDMLKRAVRWFAKGERERHIDDRKLSYITAVDLFFSHVGPGATKRLCKGFAFAVADDDQSVAPLARYMLLAFASRSDTAHAGQLDLMDGESIRLLRWYVQRVITSMARQPFNSKVEVRKWALARTEALSKEDQRALAYAVDWKSVNAEQCLETITATLGRFIVSNLFDEPDARISRKIMQNIGYALRVGGSFVRDLKPIALRLDPILAEILERATAEAVTSSVAKAYLDAVVREFERLDWMKPSLKDSVETNGSAE